MVSAGCSMVVVHLIVLNYFVASLSSSVPDGTNVGDVKMSPLDDRCVDGCLDCSPINGCLTCQPSFYLFLRREGPQQRASCTQQCPVGFYPVERDGYAFCKKCTMAGCIACVQSDHCTTCSREYTNAFGNCVRLRQASTPESLPRASASTYTSAAFVTSPAMVALPSNSTPETREGDPDETRSEPGGMMTSETPAPENGGISEEEGNPNLTRVQSSSRSTAAPTEEVFTARANQSTNATKVPEGDPPTPSEAEEPETNPSRSTGTPPNPFEASARPSASASGERTSDPAHQPCRGKWRFWRERYRRLWCRMAENKEKARHCKHRRWPCRRQRHKHHGGGRGNNKKIRRKESPLKQPTCSSRGTDTNMALVMMLVVLLCFEHCF